MKLQTVLSDIFPPPSALRMPAVALDVSDTSVKYIKFVPSKDFVGFEIEYSGSVDLEAGAVVNGSLEKIDILAKAIARVAEHTSCKFVRMSLPEEHAYIFETSVRSKTEPKAVRSAIELKLEENVPLPPREAVFDYTLEVDELNESQLRAVVTAYSRTMVEKYAEACDMAGVVPVAFEVEAEALARSVVPRGEVGAWLVIDLGETRTGIGIVQNGSLRYTSTIEVGSSEMFDVLKIKQPQVDAAEFFRLLNQEGVLVKGIAYEGIAEVLTKIIHELRLRLQYWDNQMSEMQKPAISKIILCGGNANIKGIAVHFEEALDLPVEIANVWQHAFSLEAYIPDINYEYSLGYATAIGLALGDHQLTYTHD